MLTNFNTKGEIIYRVELPDMEQITLIYLENSDADYCKSCKKHIHDIACEFDQYYHSWNETEWVAKRYRYTIWIGENTPCNGENSVFYASSQCSVLARYFVWKIFSFVCISYSYFLIRNVCAQCESFYKKYRANSEQYVMMRSKHWSSVLWAMVPPQKIEE